MRELAFFNCIEKIAVGLIFLFIFCLSVNSTYAQNVTKTASSASLSDNYGKEDTGSALADKYGNQLSLSTDITQSAYPELAGKDAGYSSDELSGDRTGAGASAGDWNYSLAVYAWLLGLNGTVGVKGQTSDVNMSFGDIWDQFDVGGSLHGELLYKNKYGFIIDPTFIKLSTNDVDDPVKSTRTKIWLVEIIGFYRIFDIPTKYGQSQGYKKSSVALDVLFGGRYLAIDNKITFNNLGPVSPPSVSGKKDWFDFIVGGRVIWQATDRWSLIGRTDFGGFDFNFSSKFSWNGVGFVGYDPVDWMQILLGFRGMYIDYTDGSGDNRFVFDSWLYGPMIGLNFHN